MKVVIVGCGRSGSRLANLLDEDGHEVSIIDSQSEAFHTLRQGFQGQIILGIPIDEDVLRQAGIEKADAFVALTHFDNTNIMAAQVAKEIFKVPKVILRIHDPPRLEIYSRMGMTAFSPTVIGVDFIRKSLGL